MLRAAWEYPLAIVDIELSPEVAALKSDIEHLGGRFGSPDAITEATRT